MSSNFLQIGKTFLDSSIPFCLVRVPNKEPELYMNPKTISSSNEKVFICKGWERNDPTYYFQSYSADINLASLVINDEFPFEASFEDYSKSYNLMKLALEEHEIQKVVLSRVKKHDSKIHNPIELFDSACSKSQDTLVYLILHPTYGLWFGMSPEILVSKRNKIFTTVSLAGTQKNNNGTYHWGHKEIEEQELVSVQIRETLEKLNSNNYIENGPVTHQAGKVVHLKSVFTYSFNGELSDLLNSLHPTPAISGLPIKESIDLINKVENHSRKLYTGYLGVIDNDSADIFVNLRCMQIVNNVPYLYLGGGLTAQSELMDEWKETELKSKTILDLIDGK